jgi:hypothetical protein
LEIKGIHVGFWWKQQKERDHKSGQGVSEQIIQDRVQWWTVLDPVTNLRVQSNIRKFFNKD